MTSTPKRSRARSASWFSWPVQCVGFVLGIVLTILVVGMLRTVPPDAATAHLSPSGLEARDPGSNAEGNLSLQPRQYLDTSGYSTIVSLVCSWPPEASLEEISQHWKSAAERVMQIIDNEMVGVAGQLDREIPLQVAKASCQMYAGAPEKAYATLSDARDRLETHGGQPKSWMLASVIYFQGVAGLRLGENDNCILCRGESSCILPIRAAAVHTNPQGSRLAIQHFTEYLRAFPDDVEVRWLLNVAHMTLGEHPEKVDPQHVISLERYTHAAADIGRFRDIGALVGVNRLNQAGGAIMEDFDNDGLLDLAVTSFDCMQPMALYRNAGNGTFQEITEAAGLSDQLGGLNCVQTDYNNDGRMDIYIPRGAWLPAPIRPSLLRNEGQGRFTDVTKEAGLLDPVNSATAQWADYDNDGWLDVYVCCENQRNRLYRNLGSGSFEEVAVKAGVAGSAQFVSKGCAWIDYDNDDYPDLFVNSYRGTGQLYHNNRDGTFSRVTDQAGIDGPVAGFSCWSWDYDNDGWLDLFATCYDRRVEDVVKGLNGQPHSLHSNRLYRNQQGQGFEDVTGEAGLDLVLATMGSNYGDMDNDGYLDMYLGTGEPSLAALVPNRMFKNEGGRHFVEITGPAGVGHLQKGHGVACGDWDRDGNIDVFIQMGGAIDGDRYHNILFQNPGHDNAWLTVKLVGVKTNRAAIGARIKVVTAAADPLVVHRHVSSGSSFGANPLEQTIGLGRADKIAELEIRWPTSQTTQVFRDLDVNQAIEITEFQDDYKTLDWKQISLPEE